MIRHPPRSTLFPTTPLSRPRGVAQRRHSVRRGMRVEPHLVRQRARGVEPTQHEAGVGDGGSRRSEEHTSELQSQSNLVCRLLLEKKNNQSSYLLIHDVSTRY